MLEPRLCTSKSFELDSQGYTLVGSGDLGVEENSKFIMMNGTVLEKLAVGEGVRCVC